MKFAVVVFIAAVAALSALLPAPGAHAQSQARPDPADPNAAVPAFGYQSAFGDYKRHTDPAVRGWREVNDEVGRIGGHAGALRAAPSGEGHGAHAPLAPPAPPATPAPGQVAPAPNAAVPNTPPPAGGQHQHGAGER
jgi:hypothetical protein